MHFAHGADRSVADQFDDPPHAAERVALIAHLRDDVHFVRNLAHPPRFVDRMRERLLAVDVFAHVSSPSRWPVRDDGRAWRP